MKKPLKCLFRVFAPAVVVLLVLAGIVYAQNPNGIRGAFAGNVFVRSPFRLGIGGHLGADSIDLAGTCTLGTSCVITFKQVYNSAPFCVGTDQTAAAAVKAVSTTTTLTLTGTGTDVLDYHCIANIN